MIFRSKSISRAVHLTCKRLPRRTVSRRTFFFSPHLTSATTLQSEDADRKPIVTQKKFSELPKVEGIPCNDWSGGLDDIALRKPRKKSCRRLSQGVPPEGSPMSTFTSGLTKSPRKCVKGTNQTNVVANSASVEDDNGMEPKLRRRRKPSAVLVEKSEETNLSSTQPRNQLAIEILKNLAEFPHCILLTRVGQFYESYFDQAAEVSRLLNIKLTTRVWDGHRVLMCGFPLMHLDKYLRILVQQNKRFVAMCEEFSRPPSLDSKVGFDRRVVRVITPGTLIDEPFLNQYENNYLLAINSTVWRSSADFTLENPVGLAWIDISTGEFFTNGTTYQSLRDELVRIAPREVVIDKALQMDAAHPIRQTLSDEGSCVSYISPPESTFLGSALNGHNTTDSGDMRHDTLVSATTPHETSAVKLLTTFLHANLLEHMPQLPVPRREPSEGRMQIDAHTINALEIREGIREGGTTGSLLSVIKRTMTTSGTRLLSRWLCSPSTSIKEINARQSLVAFFYARPHLRGDLLEALAKTEDLTRIAQKFLLGKGDLGDLLAINGTISVWSVVRRRVELEKEMEAKERGDFDHGEWSSLDALMSRMSTLHDLSDNIKKAVQLRPSTNKTLHTSDNIGKDILDDRLEPFRKFDTAHKWSINPEFSETLMTHHTRLRALMAQREQLELELQIRYDAPSLSLRTSPGQGMHVHLAKNKRDQKKLNASPLFVGISESASTKTYFHQGWAQLGSDIFETNTALLAAEKQAFEILRAEVNTVSEPLRRNSKILDELDVTLAFASLATEMNFTRPVLKDDTSFEIVNGRHPTVELGLLKSGRVFTPNTISFTPDERLHIVTGPNMAGKSTSLRQTALIAILAQTGSFVPADSAVIGIVDKLFARVGAKDDLFRDRSTFMVEMLETAEILQRATSKSLVIMDEVGRGTTVNDGLAIAFSTVHHLVSVNQCRALFATHFHELSDMLGNEEYNKGRDVFKKVAFFCTDLDETSDDHFAYSYRLKPGINRDSHGLKVAQLAGMPSSVVTLAKEALVWLKPRELLNTAELRTLGQSLTREQPPLRQRH